MANDPNEYRDPKVGRSDPAPSRSWVWIALAVVAGVILLAFVFGAFGGGETATEEVPVVVEEEEPVEEGAVETAPNE